jgi:hypothetical protein
VLPLAPPLPISVRARAFAPRLLACAIATFILLPVNLYAACTSPAGAEGEVVYNDDYNVMQFCNGTSWVSMAAPSLVETDPQVGTVTSSNFCKANVGGTAIDCSTANIAISDIGATGTASATTYLRGDGTWAVVDSVTPAGTVPGAIQFRGVTAVLAADDVNFIWDDTNNRLGIGTATPAYPLDNTGKSRTATIIIAGGVGANAPAFGGGAESDPQVGTLTASNWCKANGGGTAIDCGTSAISISDLGTTGTASNTTYLRGDGVWTAVSAGGSGDVNSGTLGQMAYYASTGTAVSGNANATISSGILTLGVSSSVVGKLVLSGNTSGGVTIQPQAAAGTYNFNLPITAGTSGHVLTSGGGAAAPMTWTALATVATSGSATDLTTGTLPDARFPATLPAASGVNLTNLDASDLATGTVPTARLGTGTASSSTFLRGDGEWIAPSFSLPALTNGTIWVGNVSNAATAVTLSGDATISNAGVLAIGAAKITNTMLAGSIALSKLDTTGTASNSTFLRGDGVWIAPGGGGSGTVNSGTAGQMAYYATSAAAVSGNANATISSGVLTLGVSTSAIGKLVLAGNTSGAITIAPQAAAGTYNFNLPTTAGSSGTVLTSGGGVAAPMTWTTLATVATSGSATDLTTGTLPDARFPATLPAASGVNLTNLDASDLATGTVPTARLGTGTANNTTYLRGDGAWTTPSGGGGSPAGTAGAVQFTNGTAFTADSSNFFWDDTNNRLGIGTATPTRPLDVVYSTSNSGDQFPATFRTRFTGAGNGWNNVVFDNVGTNASAGNSITLAKNGTPKWFFGNDIGGSGNQDFYIHDDVAGAIRLSVASNGNVGIGVNTASTKLEVNGTATATLFAGSGASLTALNATNLGSGTVPVARLGASGTASSSTYLRGDNTWATPAGGGGSPSGTAGAVQFSNGSAFASDVSNIFFDDTNNRLGVGTNSPVTTLHVRGTSAAVARFSSTNADGAIQLMGSGTTNPFEIGVNAGDMFIRVNGEGSDRLRINGQGVYVTLLQTPEVELPNDADSASYFISSPAALSSSKNFVLPSTAGSNGNVLKTDGAGNTSWGTMAVSNITATGTASSTTYLRGDGVWIAPSASIAADSLNFTDFADSMTLDAATTIAGATTAGLTVTQSGSVAALTITNTGSGNSLLVNDVASDTTPFVINASGNVGIGTAAGSAKMEVRADASNYPAFFTSFDGWSAIQVAGVGGDALTMMANDSGFGGIELDADMDLNITVSGTGITRLWTGGGERVTVREDGKVGIGTGIPSHILHIAGQGRATNSAWATSSDRRVKTDIKPLGEGLATIMKLDPVTYEYIDAYKKGKEDMNGKRRGFIAQEVEQVIPDMVKIIDEPVGDSHIKDFRLLTNSDFVPILVKAVQDLKHENDSLKKQVDKISVLEAEIQALKEAVKHNKP